MTVSFTIPFRRSWDRMVRMLFRPFRLDAWMTLGFAAFLSGLLDHVGPQGRGAWKEEGGIGAGHVIRGAAAFLLHPVWGPLALVVAAVSLALLVVLFCLASRGKLVFLDDVVHERAAIAEPWRRFGPQADGLFAWWIAFAVVCALVVIAVSLPMIPAVLAAVANSDFKMLAIASLLGWIALMIPLGLAAGCTLLFLFQFVVPIMVAQKLGVSAAWGRFLGLFRRHPGPFLLFGLAYFAISIAVAACIAALGLATCCVGFLVLGIPYVGSVILLPVEVLLRGLGPDFLAQFGPEWSVFEPAGPPLPPTEAPPAAASPAA